MNNTLPMLRTENVVRILLPLFFVSGATSLAYQLLWMRDLQLVFGTSTFAVSTLLASFMVGLAAGGFAISRFADRILRPLAVYGVLELCIGIYALIFPFLLESITPLYLAVWRSLEPGPVLFGFVQFGLVSMLLLLPTAAMGATLPLLARLATLRLGAAGERVGTLYSVNTFGAVAGIGICGFLLIPQFGIHRTTVMVAAANLALGLVAVYFQRHVTVSAATVEDDLQITEAKTPLIVAVYVAVGLAGFSALVYEVAWTRLLALMLGSSAYSFSVMLIAFLGGIALGGKIGGRVADRMIRTGGRTRVMLTFAVIEIGIAMCAYTTMYLYAKLPFWYVLLFDQFGVQENPQAIWWVSLLLAGLVMILPAVLMGMHFPVAVRAMVGSGKNLGRPVGTVYGVNALGGAAGAFVAGFVLLPNLAIQGTIVVAVASGLVAASVLVMFSSGKQRRRWLLVPPIALLAIAFLIVGQRPPWNPLLMTAGMYHYVSKLEDHSREGVLRYSVDLYDLVYYEEGLSSVVTVAQNRGSSHRWLAINGKVDASTTDDMPTQVLLSLLPMQFVEQPENVLVIGLASGVTAGAASLVQEVRQLQIVELEPAISRAARYFEDWNHAVLSDSRVDVVHNDGRNHLLLAEPDSYDIVISEPSNPWISGVSNLFTREFLELGKSRLKPGGVWSQWVPIYGMDSRDLRSILKTFGDVYAHVAVYATIHSADLVLIGSEQPLPPADLSAMRLLERTAVAGELRRVGVNSAVDLVSLYVMDQTGIAAMSDGIPFNTDDNMYIEFSTSKKLHQDTGPVNFEFLLEHANLPELSFDDDPDQWARLATSYRRQGDAGRAEAAMSRSIEVRSSADRDR